MKPQTLQTLGSQIRIFQESRQLQVRAGLWWQGRSFHPSLCCSPVSGSLVLSHCLSASLLFPFAFWKENWNIATLIEKNLFSDLVSLFLYPKCSSSLLQSTPQGPLSYHKPTPCLLCVLLNQLSSLNLKSSLLFRFYSGYTLLTTWCLKVLSFLQVGAHHTRLFCLPWNLSVWWTNFQNCTTT